MYLVPFLGYLTLNNIVTLKFGLEVTQGHSKWYQNGTIRKLGCGFLFTFHSDKARYWLQIVIFFIPSLHSAPPLGGSPSEYYHPVWCGKTRMVGLPDGEKTLRICITVYTQYRLVSDGQTDRRRNRHLATP